MNWTFWQNIVSPHLAPLARALACLPGHSVTLMAENEMPQRRTSMGWHTPDCAPARVLVRPTEQQVERQIAGDPRRPSVHLVNGWSNVALNRRVLPHLASTGALVGLISEGADSHGFPGLARRAKYALQRLMMGRHLHFILAMGQLGVDWFRAAGYKPASIFPFAYVTERPIETTQPHDDPQRNSLRILYLGRILRWKDGITAIRALQNLTARPWQFDVVGDGPDLLRWRKVAAGSDRIRFFPPVDNQLIGNLLAHADLLLLPSRKDGWGAVVNEALLSGVPVICSDRCGAADLLREPWRGTTFAAGSVKSLERALETWMEPGQRNPESSARIRAWSSAIEGPRVAQYLLQVVSFLRDGGDRPSPPWY